MGEDLTARARLRDAAIELLADGGAAAVSARSVAERAGVTSGLIRHHFGSMAGLLDACDDHVAAIIRDRKGEGMAQGLGFDSVAALRDAGNQTVMAYLARRIPDDAPAIAQLVDQIVDDAVGYLRVGQESGLVTATDDDRGRAAILTMFSLGSLTMHRHLARHFGIDITSADLVAQPGYPRYLLAMVDALGAVIEPGALETYRTAIAQLREKP
ncbi:TetR family transcriptional regulator [Tessaracoccus palaemonis]|uniref:TetR family transcriptional regulator n=1 Tax=Tessaracoccus palaemonis TaxID=2829499 RepID=A0ABX8SJR9_9ACTN|nr:TetR family transcriptional regulator [Tessaracoccus palaemonis]QXT63622.1 TetR family transcriptional regulator [Tessaracoccus palaemonis]